VERRPNFRSTLPSSSCFPEQGCVELQRDAAGKVHHFHTHPVDEILVIISGRLNFMWEGGERICGAGDTILLPAGTLHQSEALDGGAVYAIANTAAGDDPERRLKAPRHDNGWSGADEASVASRSTNSITS